MDILQRFILTDILMISDHWNLINIKSLTEIGWIQLYSFMLMLYWFEC